MHEATQVKDYAIFQPFYKVFQNTNFKALYPIQVIPLDSHQKPSDRIVTILEAGDMDGLN